ncbi:hypothetical protein [Streptomyces sp. H27-D2]|uniref:hypothetical protein n=1 Tax=Streptomyces sp. H27-D2 TaxID=3046304 RepID=UPI002DB9AE93|nr:hypothetical protein [Streptomyces sp. H27-D2]MEC4016070.1 hypothetical protein [Streptomyces sp. H27-D2]
MSSTAQPGDGTPTNDPAAALHWAAVAIGLADARERQGHPLTDAEHVNYDRFLAAARDHGFSDEEIRDYLDVLHKSLAITTS